MVTRSLSDDDGWREIPVRYLIGLDIGTTGVKGLVIDGAGRVVKRAFEGYPLENPRPGWAEQNPADWWRATVSVLRELLSQNGAGREIRAEDIAGIGLSGQMHSSVFLDASGEVVRPAILWCDVRTSDECRWITAAVGGRERLIELTCNPALEGFTAPKIIWLRDHEPENFKRVAKVLLPKDYIRYRMTGEMATEVSDAAGTLLFDVAGRRWSRDVLNALGLNEGMVPPYVESQDVCGRITREVADATGLLEGTPVVAGGADNTCGAVGAGIVKEGRVLTSIGSSGVVVAHTDRVMKDPLGRVHTFNHSVPERWYLMGVMLSAGMSFKWFRDALAASEKEVERLSGIDAYEILSREAAKVPAGSEGLIFLPYLTGERTPHADADARGVFFGLNLRHTKAHMARAVMEGVVFGLKDSLEIIKSTGIHVDEVRAIGGGAKSQVWRQIQADILGVDIVTLNIEEGPAFGAALLAGVGVGVYPNVIEAAENTIKAVTRVSPAQDRQEAYQGYYEIYKDLYVALKDNFKKLSRQVQAQ